MLIPWLVLQGGAIKSGALQQQTTQHNHFFVKYSSTSFFTSGFLMFFMSLMFSASLFTSWEKRNCNPHDFGPGTSRRSQMAVNTGSMTSRFMSVFMSMQKE